jgi:hypothetical protein
MRKSNGWIGMVIQSPIRGSMPHVVLAEFHGGVQARLFESETLCNFHDSQPVLAWPVREFLIANRDLRSAYYEIWVQFPYLPEEVS